MIGVLRHLRQLALPRNGGILTDGQLLERFLATRDESAFEAILCRHGPMVMGVCRRVLPCVQDAEDAFQATFLVLVHKAGSVAAREAVGSWLYGVAYRTACKARVSAARRRAKEMQMARPEAQQEPDDLWRELRPLLDQELSRLPEKYRGPVVLCDLQGQTRKQAAAQLGCPEGTVSGRLARARGMLAKRLARHGRVLSTAAFATALAQGNASACVRPPLVGSTIKAATLVAAGHAPAGVVSAPVAALTAGVLKAMSISKLKVVFAALAVGLVGIGLGVSSWGADDSAPQPQPPAQGAGGGGGVQAPAPEKINLPSGPAPVQVLASIDADGKLVIKRAVMQAPALPAPGAGFPGLPGGPAPGGGGGAGAPGAGAPGAGAPGAGVGAPGGGAGLGAPGGGGAPGAGGGPGAPGAPGGPPPGPGGVGAGFPGAGGRPGGFAPGGPGAGRGPGGFGPAGRSLQVQTYDLDNVEVLDAKGNKLDRKEVTRLLKNETVALATWYAPLDLLHLRVVKDGTLTFVLPGFGAAGAPGLPGGPGFRPGLPGGAPGAVPPLPPQPVPVVPDQP
jgi:RNA polymerase sigma factor (sigma-70 family)